MTPKSLVLRFAFAVIFAIFMIAVERYAPGLF
jgi:hypothetical protein